MYSVLLNLYAYLCRERKNKGVPPPRGEAEIIPSEPEAGHAAVGIGYNALPYHRPAGCSPLCLKKRNRMKITVNNKEVDTQAANLLQLTEELALPAQGVAVAISNRMIPRTEWAETALTEGANVVIIKAACGG